MIMLICAILALILVVVDYLRPSNPSLLAVAVGVLAVGHILSSLLN